MIIVGQEVENPVADGWIEAQAMELWDESAGRDNVGIQEEYPYAHVRFFQVSQRYVWLARLITSTVDLFAR